MTYVLHAIAFVLGGLAGVWLTSLATANKIAALEARTAEATYEAAKAVDEAHRLRKRLYERGHRA